MVLGRSDVSAYAKPSFSASAVIAVHPCLALVQLKKSVRNAIYVVLVGIRGSGVYDIVIAMSWTWRV